MLTAPATTFWTTFVASTGVEAMPAGQFRFGDSPEMADALLNLVLQGPKRATAGLRRSLDEADMPVVGSYWVVLDGRDAPRAVIRSTEVTVKPLCEVDEAFARDEGEGDRSRAGWLRAHTDYFTREAERDGFRMHPDIEVVFERFELVWPVSS